MRHRDYLHALVGKSLRENQERRASKLPGFGLGQSWTLCRFIFSIMVWTLLLFLFSSSPDAMCQYTLTQETALSASLGEPAKLSCNISSGYYFGDFHWYQQKGGERPRFLLYYNTTSRETKFGPEASGHFSASTNTPKKSAFLNINNVQGKDEGGYYCLAGRHNVCLALCQLHKAMTQLSYPNSKAREFQSWIVTKVMEKLCAFLPYFSLIHDRIIFFQHRDDSTQPSVEDDEGTGFALSGNLEEI
ncbi:hypothetical protein Chor_013077 [Crotalus horridus]